MINRGKELCRSWERPLSKASMCPGSFPLPILRSVHSNPVFSWSGAFIRSDDSVPFDFPWPSRWHLRGVKRAVQTNIPLCHSANPTLQDQRRNLAGRVGKDLHLALPLLDWGANSSFHSKRESLLFGLRFSSLSLALAQEKQERGRLILICAEAAANPHRTTLSATGIVLFLGITCWRGCVCTGRVGSLYFSPLFGCHARPSPG